MAGKKTAQRRNLTQQLQKERSSGFLRDRPFLFKVDGGNIPQLRPNESSKSFFKRIKDWERFTGKNYPKSSELNRLKLRGGGNKDYSEGANWNDEKKGWVSQEQAAKKLDTSLSSDIAKESFITDPTGYQQYKDKPPVPTNQKEIDAAQYPFIKDFSTRRQQDLKWYNDQELANLNQSNMIDAVSAQSDQSKNISSYESMSGTQVKKPAYERYDPTTPTDYDAIYNRTSLSTSTGAPITDSTVTNEVVQNRGSLKLGEITPDLLGGRLPAGMSIEQFNRARRANQVTETNKGYFVSNTSGARKFVPKPKPLQTNKVYVK